MRNLEPSWGDKMQNDQPHGDGFMSPTVYALCCYGLLPVRCTYSGEGNGDELVAEGQVCDCNISYTSCNVSVSSGLPRSTLVLRHSTCPSAWNPLRLQWAFSASAELLCAVKYSTTRTVQ